MVFGIQYVRLINSIIWSTLIQLLLYTAIVHFNGDIKW